MSDISIRPATRRDAADLAILDNLAGHFVSFKEARKINEWLLMSRALS